MAKKLKKSYTKTKEKTMKIKRGTKVKFSDAAEHLKSYDADAVGVVTTGIIFTICKPHNRCGVKFTYPCGRTKYISDIGTGNLDRVEQQQVTLKDNAKPKEESRVNESTERKTLYSALAEVSVLNEQIATLTKQRDEAQEYIVTRNAEHGVRVDFGVAVVGQPEQKILNITDWRDLMPGDVIETASTEYDTYLTNGRQYIVAEVESNDYVGYLTIRIIADDNGDSVWLNNRFVDWKFISRPS
jgi:hypothetical protein